MISRPNLDLSVASSLYVSVTTWNLSEWGPSLLFAKSSESMVALVIPRAIVGHAHPETGCSIVPGP